PMGGPGGDPSRADAACAARGLPAGSPDYQVCVEALHRGKAYAPPGTPRDELNSLFYQACVGRNNAPGACACLVAALQQYDLKDEGMRSLLLKAGAIYEPPGSGFINVTPIFIATDKCKLKFP